MKRLCPLTAVLVLVGTLGCDPSDPNQNLKPIDPNTPPPKQAMEGKGPGGKGASDRPPSVIR